jgi:hypothetical protein
MSSQGNYNTYKIHFQRSKWFWKRCERCLAVPEVGHAVIMSCWLQLCTVLGWIHTCNVTAYRNTVSWQCGRDSCPRNVSKVGYAVTLRACSVCCRYLAVASKGWYGYDPSRCGRASVHVSGGCFCPSSGVLDCSFNAFETPVGSSLGVHYQIL